MDKQCVYTAPTSTVIELQGRDAILELSNFGQDNAPGSGYGSGDIIPGGLF